MVKIDFRTFQIRTLRRVRIKVRLAQVVQLGVGLSGHDQAAALVTELMNRPRLSVVDNADVGKDEHLSVEAAHRARSDNPELNMILQQKKQHCHHRTR